MKKSVYIPALIVFCVAVISSCKKAEERTCLKSAGEEEQLEIALSVEPDTLYLFDNIEYEIIPDTINFVQLEGGKNLLKHVEILEKDKRIDIQDRNKCRFLRNYKKKIKAKIHLKETSYIHYEGGEELISRDTLKSGELRLFIRDGAGPVSLIVENGYMSATISHGWGDFTLKGKTLYCYLSCSTNSFCDATELQVENTLKVNSNTEGDMKVNADGAYLDVDILRKGNVLYTGNPTGISLKKEGDGDLIDMDP
ncbi:MAG: DUF2807 domain-containing protein [Brumimicrobium sp.]|nr:DUF2807 domain-containing protein [Brumimicrobium sp.]